MNYEKKTGMAEAMEVLANYEKACYNQGFHDSVIGGAIGAGLAMLILVCVGAKTIHDERKNGKLKKELENSILNRRIL